MANTAIRAENLGKRYRIGTADARYETFRETVLRAASAPFRNFRRIRSLGSSGSVEAENVVWALRDVSFEVKHGEVIGIIGRNGAGKSTLLKVLSRITKPTTGRAVVDGRVGSLLEVGTGFHPELTGRDNIFLNGSILGMDKRLIERRFDEIVAFSGVERFIDTPVKRYSSGMYLRLAFAVAAHLEPEVLIVDEVLAVGDAEFQKKCLGKMEEVAGEGRTVLFVSHNLAAVANLCSRGLLMQWGRIAASGGIGQVLQEYRSSLDRSARLDVEQRDHGGGDGSVRIEDFWIEAEGHRIGTAATGLELSFKAAVENPLELSYLQLMIGVYNEQNQRVLAFTSDGSSLPSQWPRKGVISCRLNHPLALSPGLYSINVSLFASGHLADRIPDVVELEVTPGIFPGAGTPHPAYVPLFFASTEWDLHSSTQ